MAAKNYDSTMVNVAGVPTTALPRTTPVYKADDSLTTRTDSAFGGVEGLPPGGPLLVAVRGPNAGARFLIDQPVITLGRHPNSNIYLDDVTVSRRHAELRWANGELRIIDVGSLNGTYVNREAVESAVLIHGDELQLGKFRLMLWLHPDLTEGLPN